MMNFGEVIRILIGVLVGMEMTVILALLVSAVQVCYGWYCETDVELLAVMAGIGLIGQLAGIAMYKILRD